MLRKYYDLHITTRPPGTTASLTEPMIRMAERLGFEAIAVANRAESAKDIAAMRQELQIINPKIKVLVGAKIDADNPSKLDAKVSALREHADLIVVSGGDVDINRRACENPKVDILAHPELRRKDSGLDHVMAEFASKNGVAIELNFAEFLHSYKKIRAHILDHMRRNAMLAEKYHAPLIVTSGAENIYGLRPGRDLASLAYLAGLRTEIAIRTTTDVPEMIIKRSEQEKSPDNVMPGVRILRE